MLAKEISHARIETNLEHRKKLNGGSYRPYLGRESDDLAGTLSDSRRSYGWEEDGGDLVFEVAGERGGCVAWGEASQEREEKDEGQREKKEDEPREEER
ncbi:unnamed protein product [Malus baccata var. baccata]